MIGVGLLVVGVLLSLAGGAVQGLGGLLILAGFAYILWRMFS